VSARMAGGDVEEAKLKKKSEGFEGGEAWGRNEEQAEICAEGGGDVRE